MSTWPASGTYSVKNFPISTNTPNTKMTLKITKINNTTYKFYMTMHCQNRSWDAGSDKWYKLIIEYYNSSNTKLGEDPAIPKRIVYKGKSSEIRSNWNNGKFYDWNFKSKSSSITAAKKLNMIKMNYDDAIDAAAAEGLAFYSGYLAAGEPFGIRFASDNQSTFSRVYALKNLAYTDYPTTPSSTSAWPTGYGRTTSDAGVQFTISPPQNAAYFKGRVEWYNGSTKVDTYTFPTAGASIPADQQIDTSSKAFYKSNNAWGASGYAWEKVNGTWTKRNIYKKESGTWTKI